MKKLIIAILLIPTLCFAQMEKTFITNSRADVQSLVNDVLSLTKNQYLVEDVDSLFRNGNDLQFYLSIGDHRLNIEFTNIDSQYTFVLLSGAYEDVFPFWKKYYQPDADELKIKAAGNGKVVITPFLKGSMFSTFDGSKNLWQLANRYSPDPNKM